VAVFEGDLDVSTRLLALPFNHIFFTGSPAVGKIVMRAAAQHLASVTLELGGKSPAIVDETADLDKTVRNLVWGKFSNNGQTCVAPDHVYVHESVRDVFLDKMQARIQQVYGADAATQQRSADYCRIVNDRHFMRLHELLQDAIQRGARVVAGGSVDAGERFIAPTVLTDVAPASEIMEEEIFGPLLPVLGYAELDAVLQEINSRPKPLALYVFSKNQARIEQVLSNTSAGGSCVNHSVVHFLHGNLPFGGVNNSGIGNSHGVYGFKAFSHERAVLIDRFSSTHLLSPPYTARVRSMIKLVSRFFA
jgi:aldehyde dehydrogenase (NAD+)